MGSMEDAVSNRVYRDDVVAKAIDPTLPTGVCEVRSAYNVHRWLHPCEERLPGESQDWTLVFFPQARLPDYAGGWSMNKLVAHNSWNEHTSIPISHCPWCGLKLPTERVTP